MKYLVKLRGPNDPAGVGLKNFETTGHVYTEIESDHCDVKDEFVLFLNSTLDGGNNTVVRLPIAIVEEVTIRLQACWPCGTKPSAPEHKKEPDGGVA